MGTMISVTILAKNSDKHLDEVLDSVRTFDEVVLYDTGSQDSTFEIAKKYSNVTIYSEEFKGFGPTHNEASSAAKNDWILSIDSDEVVTPEMLQEIESLELDKNKVYSFPRHNYFNGKWIRWCGWYPDRVVRLYNRKKTKFSESMVHEAIVTDRVEKISMTSPIRHYSYDSIDDFLDKMQRYSSLFAEQNQGKKSSSLFKAIFRGFWTFLKCYFLKRGFLGGYEGFVISAYNGHTAYYKYLKLHEANQKESK